MVTQNHLNYLQSVNNLSIRNIGLTGKNPSVACLIVDYSKSSKGIILSYGLTSKNGRPHAEINALKKISLNKINNKTVMYVSLEPCFKKNSCCAKAIVKAGIKKVFISSLDPNPNIKGKGIDFLKKQKIKVFHSLKSTDRFKIINKFFYTRKILNRPFITLKIAISKNGFSKSPTHKNITSDQTQYFMHQLRLSHDAIAVGMNTVLDDKPKLTCRLQGVSKNISKLIFSNKEIKFKNYKLITVDYKKTVTENFSLFKKLKTQSILIEGGLNTFKYFLNCNLFDEVIVCQSNMNIKNASKKYFLSMKLITNNLILKSSLKYGEDMIYKFTN